MPAARHHDQPRLSRTKSLEPVRIPLGCWLPGEVAEPDQGEDAVVKSLGVWALIDLGKPADKVAVTVGPDTAADPLDGLQLGVAELVFVATRPTASRTQRAGPAGRSWSAWATSWSTQVWPKRVWSSVGTRSQTTSYSRKSRAAPGGWCCWKSSKATCCMRATAAWSACWSPVPAALAACSTSPAHGRSGPGWPAGVGAGPGWQARQAA